MKILIHKKKIPLILLIILVLTTVALIVQYGWNLRYNFSEPSPFKGSYLYNPYHKIDTSNWQTANFHAHTHKVPDIMNAAESNSRFLDSIYSYLGYHITGISDYQMINTFEERNPWFIPEYEHGYMIFKNHHLVLNAKKISWLDYFFIQTLDNKQYVINRLKEDSAALVTIVHPGIRYAVTHKNLKYLANYDFLEVIDNLFQFLSFYDTALSNGHHVFLLANDDSHNQRNQNECAVCFNIINTVLYRDSVLSALKAGKAIAVKLNTLKYQTFESKKTAIQLLPKLIAFNVRNDTISLKLNRKVRSIKFIGQEGSGMKSIQDTSVGIYFFTKNDTYIRTEIECYDGTRYYLNPVFRYNGVFKSDLSPPVNLKRTFISRSATVAILIIVLIFLYSDLMNKKKRDRS
jgi:hypothetical protein